MRLFNLLFIFTAIMTLNQKAFSNDMEIQCSYFAMKQTAASLQSFQKQKGSFEMLENFKNKKIGLKDIAYLSHSWVLNQDYYKSYNEHLLNIAKMQETKKSFKQIQAANLEFVKNSIPLLKQKANSYMKDCRSYLEISAKKCGEYKNDQKALKACVDYEGKEPLKKLVDHFHKNTTFKLIKKAEKVDEELEKMIKKDCSQDKEFDEVLTRRLGYREVFFETVLPKMLLTMITNNGKNCLKNFKSLDKEIKHDIYNSFRDKAFLFETAIEKKSDQWLKFLLEEKEIKLNEKDKAKIKEIAQKNKYSDKVKTL